MSSNDLFIAFNNIEDEYINTSLECARQRLQKQTLYRWISFAACIIFILTIGASALFNTERLWLFGSGSIVYPSENARYTPYQEPYDIAKIAYYDLSAMSADSDLIVCADVVNNTYTSSASGVYDGFFTIYAELKIAEVLKGNTPQADTIYVKDHAIGFYDNNGRLADIQSVGPLMEVGNRIIVFLKQFENPIVTETGTAIDYYISLGAEGKFFFDQDKLYHCTVEYANSDYCSGSMLTSYQAKSLEEIKKEIIQ